MMLLTGCVNVLLHTVSDIRYNLHRRMASLKVGDLVLIRTHIHTNVDAGVHKKLSPRYEGPYCILSVLSGV